MGIKECCVVTVSSTYSAGHLHRSSQSRSCRGSASWNLAAMSPRFDAGTSQTPSLRIPLYLSAAKGNSGCCAGHCWPQTLQFSICCSALKPLWRQIFGQDAEKKAIDIQARYSAISILKSSILYIQLSKNASLETQDWYTASEISLDVSCNLLDRFRWSIWDLSERSHSIGKSEHAKPSCGMRPAEHEGVVSPPSPGQLENGSNACCLSQILFHPLLGLFQGLTFSHLRGADRPRCVQFSPLV